nr:11395_t:CDS:2 [Entrophospora candida]
MAQFLSAAADEAGIDISLAVNSENTGTSFFKADHHNSITIKKPSK